MLYRIGIIFVLLASASSIFAANVSTGKGKIIYTMGHTGPDCRMVQHKNNSTGVQTTFRIKDVAGDDDVSAIILTALTTNRDVDIFYDPAVTSGCGTEPKVAWVLIY